MSKKIGGNEKKTVDKKNYTDIMRGSSTLMNK